MDNILRVDLFVHAYLDVLAGSWGINEDTSALNDQVNVHGAPWQSCGVTAGNHSNVLAIHTDGLVVHYLDVSVECAQGRVILEQVASLLHTSRVVDGNHIKERVAAALPAAQEVA